MISKVIQMKNRIIEYQTTKMFTSLNGKEIQSDVELLK